MIASELVLVILGILSGMALTINVLTVLVYQQERQLAALWALGVSKASLGEMVAVQGLAISALGGTLGLA